MKLDVNAPNSIGIAVRIAQGATITARRRPIESDGPFEELGKPTDVQSMGKTSEFRGWTWPLGDFSLELECSDQPTGIHVHQPEDLSRLSPRHRKEREARGEG